jgi:FkbM family methyltransferase
MKKLNKIKLDYSDNLIAKPQFISDMHKIHSRLFEYADFIKSTDIKKIEISDDLVIMTSRESGIKMICDKDDQRVMPIEILNFNYYEKNELNLLLKLTKDGFSVFDIGSNFGWYSLNIARHFPNCKIYSFEPIPKTFNYMKANVKLNNFKNIDIYNFGFSNEEKEIIFYYYSAGSGNASLKNLSDRNKAEKIKCLVKKMDDFIDKSNVELNFIKCDVEGAELLVFQGGLKSIRKYKPIIFAEILRKWTKKFNYNPNEIIKLLSNIGYICFTLDNHKLIRINTINNNTTETNFFFLHFQKHEEEITKFSQNNFLNNYKSEKNI